MRAYRATPGGDSLTVPFDRDTVTSTPSVRQMIAPARSEARATYHHYGIPAPD